MVVSSPVPASVSASFDWMTYWNLLSLSGWKPAAAEYRFAEGKETTP
jgi:hypothetical protein